MSTAIPTSEMRRSKASCTVLIAIFPIGWRSGEKYDVLATGTDGVQKGQHLKTNSGIGFGVIGTVWS